MTRRPLPLALWLPALAVGVVLFLVFVWPTPYRYEAGYLDKDTPIYWRTNRFTGRLYIRTRPTDPWREAGRA